MAVIILHAGMAKAGSSSIQQWLGNQAGALAADHDVHAMRIDHHPLNGDLRVMPCEGSHVLSRVVGVQTPEHRGDTDSMRAAARGMFEQLDACARTRGTIVLTNEAYQFAFWRPYEPFLSELDELATAHQVRVAYYVRPQHTALEAAWRQWGFRREWSPSDFLRRRLRELDYLRTLEQVDELAPHVSFEMRPFRQDLLEGRDVVVDFAQAFLGAEVLASTGYDQLRANRGLPLELVILLREARGRLWDSHEDNERLDALRDLIVEWEIPEGDRIAQSRRVLQAFCHETFEPGNQAVIARLGWPTRHLVAPLADSIDEGTCGHDLTVLDDLWSSTASDAHRELILCALSALVSPDPRTCDQPSSPVVNRRRRQLSSRVRTFGQRFRRLMRTIAPTRPEKGSALP